MPRSLLSTVLLKLFVLQRQHDAEMVTERLNIAVIVFIKRVSSMEPHHPLSTRHRKKGSEIEEDIFCRVV
nr:hypothetical protein [Nostoc sp. ChiSLP03a]MDZ8214193.1 hypothetical protein [Nostoc sp. ChiSLP03a]